MMEDPIFEPWSGKDPVLPRRERPVGGRGTADFLRAVAVPYLEALCARLRLGRHHASLDDLLDEPERLLRFRLIPWLGPLSDPVAEETALLEIGLGGERDESAMVWHWIDRSGQAPDRTVTVPSSKLTASWVERVVLDFVGEVLERS